MSFYVLDCLSCWFDELFIEWLLVLGYLELLSWDWFFCSFFSSKMFFISNFCLELLWSFWLFTYFDYLFSLNYLDRYFDCYFEDYLVYLNIYCGRVCFYFYFYIFYFYNFTWFYLSCFCWFNTIALIFDMLLCLFDYSSFTNTNLVPWITKFALLWSFCFLFANENICSRNYYNWICNFFFSVL